MVRKCSYCREDGHNKSNCSILRVDTQRLFNEKMLEYNQLPLNRRNTTIAPTLFECKTILIENRKNQHRIELREQRRNFRIEFERRRVEESRRRYEIQRQQRENMNNLIVASIENYLRNMHTDEASRTRVRVQDYLRSTGIPRHQLSTALFRMSSSNNRVKSVETPVEANECPICYEEFSKTNKIITSCGHQYHSTCLFKHLQRNNTCPCCRGVLL